MSIYPKASKKAVEYSSTLIRIIAEDFAIYEHPRALPVIKLEKVNSSSNPDSSTSWQMLSQEGQPEIKVRNCHQVPSSRMLFRHCLI